MADQDSGLWVPRKLLVIFLVFTMQAVFAGVLFSFAEYFLLMVDKFNVSYAYVGSIGTAVGGFSNFVGINLPCPMFRPCAFTNNCSICLRPDLWSACSSVRVQHRHTLGRPSSWPIFSTVIICGRCVAAFFHVLFILWRGWWHPVSPLAISSLRHDARETGSGYRSRYQQHWYRMWNHRHIVFCGLLHKC